MHLKIKYLLLFFILCGKASASWVAGLQDNQNRAPLDMPHFQIFFFGRNIIPPEEELEKMFTTQSKVMSAFKNGLVGEEEMEQAGVEISYLASIGYSPALDLGLKQSIQPEEKAQFLVNALANQLTSTGCGELGSRVIEEFSTSDPDFFPGISSGIGKTRKISCLHLLIHLFITWNRIHKNPY